MTIVYVHGGVSGTPRPPATELAPAVASGSGRSHALDAVESAVRVLEDDPALNAGYGSVLHKEGGLELDAGIADGRAQTWAGVANVDLTNPVTVARFVMERTPHSLITGRGAQELGESWGLVRLGRSTPQRHEQWERARRDGELDDGSYARPEHVDTVGALALDEEGGLAAASSTGGVFGKLPGRVGDSPIFGAGLYADRDIAVIGTGVGELFLQTMACLRVAIAHERGASVQAACEDTVALVRARGAPGMAAGLLALDAAGELGAAFAGGSWQVEGPDGPLSAAQLH